MTAVGAEGDDDASWYRQLIADAELGASLGFDAGWIVEHHFSDYQPTPNTLLMLSHVAARCPTLGLGTAVIVTPWHHPLRIAEEIAMLSLLTKAPLRIGLGRGNAPLEYEAFGVAMAEAKDRFQECWEIIQLALKGRPFTYHGRYLTIDREITVRPYARNEQITFIGAIGHPTSAEKIAGERRSAVRGPSQCPGAVERDRAAHRRGRATGAGDRDGAQAAYGPEGLRGVRRRLPAALHHGVGRQRHGLYRV